MAGTTHLLGAVWHRSANVKASALQNASECVTFLRHVAESWPAAGHKADILHALVIDYAEPSRSVNPKPVFRAHPGQSSGSPTANTSTTALLNASPASTVPFPASLDWFASMIQNPEAVSGWETQM